MFLLIFAHFAIFSLTIQFIAMRYEEFQLKDHLKYTYKIIFNCKSQQTEDTLMNWRFKIWHSTYNISTAQ